MLKHNCNAIIIKNLEYLALSVKSKAEWPAILKQKGNKNGKNMKRDILSLKSIYQFVFVSDYPVFCPGIINKARHRGLTLTKFWKEIILIDFRNGKYGKQIWREEGGRNRYISDVCNRSARLPFFREYAEEIHGAVRPETVLCQIRQFQNFLIERQFSYNAFVQKLPLYIKYLSTEDALFSSENAAFYKRELDKKEAFEKHGAETRAFFCSYFLTFFMFHALAGNGEDSSLLHKIYTDKSLSMETLAKNALYEGRPKQNAPVFLTGKNTELCAAPLKAGHFFGRETELYELRQMLERGGKYLISGMGGIGKTELLRQLLKLCVEEKLADYICVVQYRNNLIDSLIQAFPEIHGSCREMNFREALAKIRIHASARVLLMIDDMEGGGLGEEAELQMLSRLQATVLITSRCQVLDGFERFEVKAVSKAACALVFRDNYRKQMTVQELQILDSILENPLWQHTLTLHLLGCTARIRNWTIQELQGRLQQGNILLSINEDAGYENLKQFYRRLYFVSGLKKDRNRLLQAFALLPYESYTLDFALKYLKGFLEEGMDMQESLNDFWIGGWLEKRESGYSMNPLLSECLLTKAPDETEFAPFFASAMALWNTEEGIFRLEDARSVFRQWHNDWDEARQEQIRIAFLALSAASRLNLKSCERFTEFLLFTVEIEYYSLGASTERLNFLRTLKKNKRLSETDVCYLYLLLCRYNCENAQELDREYRKASGNRNIPHSLQCAFALALAEYYLHLGFRQKAQSLADYVLESSHDADSCMCACLIKGDLASKADDYDSFAEWLKRGADIGTENENEKSLEMEDLSFGLCSLYLSLHRLDEAESVLRKIEELPGSRHTIFLRWRLLYFKGALAMRREEEGYGIDNLLQAYSLGMALSGGIQDDNLAQTVMTLAIACNKAGRHEEAVDYYRRALEIYESFPESSFYQYRVLVNMSVAYLDWNKPEEALECLNRAAPTRKSMGNLAEAEWNNNASKAWGMLGKRKEEAEYLQKAIPVLEQFYGSEDPKVKEARRRFRALEERGTE